MNSTTTTTTATTTTTPTAADNTVGAPGAEAALSASGVGCVPHYYYNGTRTVVAAHLCCAPLTNLTGGNYNWTRLTEVQQGLVEHPFLCTLQNRTAVGEMWWACECDEEDDCWWCWLFLLLLCCLLGPLAVRKHRQNKSSADIASGPFHDDGSMRSTKLFSNPMFREDSLHQASQSASETDKGCTVPPNPQQRSAINQGNSAPVVLAASALPPPPTPSRTGKPGQTQKQGKQNNAGKKPVTKSPANLSRPVKLDVATAKKVPAARNPQQTGRRETAWAKPNKETHQKETKNVKAVAARFPKNHMIGVRLGDKVIHHPLKATTDGQGIRLINHGKKQPAFDWLPELIHFYTSPRHGAPFVLRDLAVGKPSLASPSRIHLDLAEAEFCAQTATPAVAAKQTTEDLLFDAMFADLVDEVMGHVLNDPVSSTTHVLLREPSWTEGTQWDGTQKDQLESLLTKRRLPVSQLGVDAAVDEAVAAAMRALPSKMVEEALDDLDLNSFQPEKVSILRSQFENSSATEGSTTAAAPMVWNQDKQDDFAWYIPDMTRSEVTEALIGMEIGDFIVYERDDHRVGRIKADAAPTIQQYMHVPVMSNQGGDLTDSGSDVTDDGARAPNTNADGADTSLSPAEPSKKFMPMAKRVQMAARVVRRGQKLGAFMDDAHLDVEVDQATRMVVGKKYGKVSKHGYGQKMFAGLESADPNNLASKQKANELLGFVEQGDATQVNPSCCTLRPRTTPSPEENSILGVIYVVLLWADMNTATPLGARGRSVIGGGNAVPKPTLQGAGAAKC